MWTERLIELTSPTSIRPKYCSSWIPREGYSRTIRLEKRGHIGTQACLPLVSCFFPGPPACGARSSVSLEDGPEVCAVSSTRLLDFHPFHPSSDMATMTTAHAVTWSPPTPDRARTDERLEPFVWSMHQSRASTSPLTLFQPYYRTLRMPRTALADTLFHGHGKQDHQHPRIRDGRRAIERRTLFDGRPALEVREALHLPSAALPRSSLPPTLIRPALVCPRERTSSPGRFLPPCEQLPTGTHAQ